MKTRRKRGYKTRGKKIGKSWVTAIQPAQRTLAKTGSIQEAKKSLRKQALTNARILFGSLTPV